MIVHISLWPDRAVEVDDAEFLELQRQGLLVEPPEPVPPVPLVSPPVVSLPASSTPDPAQ